MKGSKVKLTNIQVEYKKISKGSKNFVKFHVYRSTKCAKNFPIFRNLFGPRKVFLQAFFYPHCSQIKVLEVSQLVHLTQPFIQCVLVIAFE